MIGGAGSLCPALVSNPALRKLRSRIFTEFFNNGDGLLVTGPVGEEDPHDMKYFRLYFWLTVVTTSCPRMTRPTTTRFRRRARSRWPFSVIKLKNELLNFGQTWEESSLRIPKDSKRKVTGVKCLRVKLQRLSMTSRRSRRRWSFVKPLRRKTIEIEENEVINYETDENAVKDSETTSLEHAILAEKTSVVEESSHDNLDYDRNLQCTDAEGEPAVDETYYDDIKHFDKYTTDDFPKDLDDTYVQKLKKRYKAIPEEFYTKSGLRPVRPENFNRWFSRMKGKGLRWHFWEWFSGSGRLSFIVMAAGLIVGFPVDIFAMVGTSTTRPTSLYYVELNENFFLEFCIWPQTAVLGRFQVISDLLNLRLKTEDEIATLWWRFRKRLKTNHVEDEATMWSSPMEVLCGRKMTNALYVFRRFLIIEVVNAVINVWWVQKTKVEFRFRKLRVLDQTFGGDEHQYDAVVTKDNLIRTFKEQHLMDWHELPRLPYTLVKCARGWSKMWWSFYINEVCWRQLLGPEVTTSSSTFTSVHVASLVDPPSWCWTHPRSWTMQIWTLGTRYRS